MRLTIIGATGSMSGPVSPASCYLVQCPGLDPLTGETRTWSIVLEMGPGSFGALWRHIDPRMIDALVLSHTHADHMGDIISLQVFRRWGPGSDLEPLPLAGPVGTLERIRQIDGTRLPDTYEGEFDIRTVRAGQSYRIGPMTLTRESTRSSLSGRASWGLRILPPRRPCRCSSPATRMRLRRSSRGLGAWIFYSRRSASPVRTRFVVFTWMVCARAVWQREPESLTLSRRIFSRGRI